MMPLDTQSGTGLVMFGWPLYMGVYRHEITLCLKMLLPWYPMLGLCEPVFYCYNEMSKIKIKGSFCSLFRNFSLRSLSLNLWWGSGMQQSETMWG